MASRALPELAWRDARSRPRWTSAAQRPARAPASTCGSRAESSCAWAQHLEGLGPYAAFDELDALREVFAAQAERDGERKEFLDLFDRSVRLLRKR